MLVKSHPFILKAKSKAVVAQLVEECMAEIDEYREQEMRERAQSYANGEGATQGTMQQGGFGEGTMVPGSSSGTMVAAGAGGDDEFGTGTMIVNNGTLVARPHAQSVEEDIGDTGTMVAALPSGGGAVAAQATAGGKFEPSYMKHLREMSIKGAPPGATATLIAKKNSIGSAAHAGLGPAALAPMQAAPPILMSPSSQAKDAAVSAAAVARAATNTRDFMEFYKTGKSIDLFNLTEASSLVDLRTALISLNKAYEEERASLDRFYEDARKYLRNIIVKKETAPKK
jgi:hypothetical protein